MTPKEKAKELVVKFMKIDSDSEMFDGFKMGLFYAKQCALIAADEVLANLSLLDHRALGSYANPKYKFWYQVKEEIEKL